VECVIQNKDDGMSFEQLFTQIESKDFDGAKATATALQGNFTETAKNLQTMEGRFNESVTKREKYKSSLSTVADALGMGVDDMTADSISELIKKGKNDDTYTAEIKSLKDKIDEMNTNYTGQLDEANQKFTSKMIENEIAKVGLTSNVVNDRALGTVVDSLKSGASINENGVVVYLDENKATKLGTTGKPLTVADRMASFQGDTDNAYLFKPTSDGGGGARPSGTVYVDSTKDMSPSQMMAAGRENK